MALEDINTVDVAASMPDTDNFLISTSDGVGPLRLARSGVATPAGKVLVVDGTSGNATTAARGRLDRPFLTPAAAKAAEQAGDVIIVYPGTYSVTTNLSTSVAKWLLLPGVTLSVTGGGSAPPVSSTTNLAADLVAQTVSCGNTVINSSGISTPGGLASQTLTLTDDIENTVDLDGSSGRYLIINLPTSDPHVRGQLWNNTGTMKVSAGP